MGKPVMPLRYVGPHEPDHYWMRIEGATVWVDAEDEEWILGPGEGIWVLRDLDEIDLTKIKGEASARGIHWKDHLRSVLLDPDEADLIHECEKCEDLEHEDDLLITVSGGYVCDPCRNHYSSCDRCGDLLRVGYDDSCSLDGYGERVWCGSCGDSCLSYCDECEHYYHPEWDDSHNHRCDCESQGVEFGIRLSDTSILRNDTRMAVTLPDGQVDQQGINRIRDLLWAEANQALIASTEAEGEPEEEKQKRAQECVARRTVASTFESIGRDWKNTDGTYPKRLARYAYKIGTKMRPDLVSEIGNIARAHSSGSTLAIESTRELNGDPDDFAHDGSCWWTEYNESRCALKTNGGFALRTFSDSGWADGRCWVMPVKRSDAPHSRWEPTTGTDNPDGYVVFNGYGELDENTGPRVMASLTGYDYKRISFGASPMYVNGSSAYLLTPKDKADEYADETQVDLILSTHSDLYDREKENEYV